MSPGGRRGPGSPAPWWSPARVDDQDIGRQLGLIGPAAWSLLALYAGVTVALGVLFGQPTSSTPSGIAVMVSLLFGAGLIVAPSPTPLPAWRTAVVIVIVVGSVVTTTWQQPFQDPAPAYSAWELGCANFLLFGLALRRRVIAAWVGETLMVGAVCLWSTQLTGSALYGLLGSYGQAVSLVAGTVFAIALHRAAKRIVDFRAAERERAGFQARDAAIAGARDAELSFVRDRVVPVLGEIAVGDSPERGEVRTLEAALRDMLRGRSLAIEPLVSALRRSRGRGVDVVVLDDLGDLIVAADQLRDVAEWSARRLEEMDAPIITIRLTGRAGGAVVTVADDRGRRQEWELGARSADEQELAVD